MTAVQLMDYRKTRKCLKGAIVCRKPKSLAASNIPRDVIIGEHRAYGQGAYSPDGYQNALAAGE